MPRALFAFDDRQAANRAADRLTAMGLRTPDVHVHDDPAEAGGQIGRKLDEQVSGGLFSNLADLFQGVFDWDKQPGEATVYREALTRGGAVVSVNLDDDAATSDVDRVMQEEGSEKSTGWSLLDKS